MAESEEFRLKRLKHEERLSRVFDEVMGLGNFADSSRGSASSSRSGGQDETKGVDETSGQGEQQPVEEEDSNSCSKGEKMDEVIGESSFPCSSSPFSARPSSFTTGTNEKGGGSGGAACDDALDGLPAFGPEEEEVEEEEEEKEEDEEEDDDNEKEDEDWHFALPTGSLKDANMRKAKRKKAVQPGVGNNATPGTPTALQPREDEDEDEEDEDEDDEEEDEEEDD
ncbi:nucleolin-like, partial [Clinocottus analis]|uniref:nucleolin-like n=1 Tax=Clinocottus analis TaxID=304258 RepID=UPI0035BF9FC0